MQISHCRNFKYWEIFGGLTLEQIKEREACYEYPPRFQFICKQMISTTKPLLFTFTVSKRSKDKEIPVMMVAGTYVVYVCDGIQ